MKSFFDLESPVMQGLSRLADRMAVNLLTIIFCIPVVTAGAAITALYDVTARLRKNEDAVWYCFWKAFISNFKKATVLWLMILGISLLFFYCIGFYLVNQLEITLLTIVAWLIIMYIMLSLYVWVFPLQARYENTIQQTIKNALICGVSNILKTILAVGLNILPFTVWFLQPEWFFKLIFVWLLLWFAFSAVIIEALCQKTFNKMEKNKSE